MPNKQTIVFNVEAEISQIKNAAKEIEKSFSNLNLSQSVQKSLSSTFSSLTKNIQDFEVAAAKGFSSLKDVNKGQQTLEKINENFTKIKITAKDLGNIDLKKLLPDSLVNKYKKLESMLKKVGVLQSKDNSKAIETATNKYDAQLKKVESLRSKLAGLQKENQSKGGTTTGLERSLQKAKERAESLVQEMTKLESERGGKSTAKYTALSNELQTVNKSIKAYSTALDENKIKINDNRAEIKNLTEQLKGEEINLTSLETKLKTLTAQGVDTTSLKVLRQDLANLLGVNLKEIPEDLSAIKNRIIEAANANPELQKIAQYLENISVNADAAKNNVSGVGAKFQKEVGDSVTTTANLNSEMDMLKSRLTYFFSAMNGIQLFKNAIRDAYESVKELDAAITEMAVVTDYSINDIWGQVPKYTQTAVELGATTKDIINSMVLYTQQGLNMSQATELSTQTMKMARIAGLEGAEATDLMTAALRGFNMELNEASAQRVNDVYSNLAANAAANTQEIADAMTRTASIANSAGMEFETTAAFLTQMINFATYTRVA